MAVTKSAPSVNLSLSKPTHPKLGDCYIDTNSYFIFVWNGNKWVNNNSYVLADSAFVPPTTEQLEKHPALKQAWDELLVIKKLLGV